MTKIPIRRSAGPGDEPGDCDEERLAGGGALECNNHVHQSPTASASGPARRRQSELIASDQPNLGLLHSIWRIRNRGIVDFVMIDRGFVARIWKSIRAAAQEFKISRMQKRSDKRFRVVEVSKCERRPGSSSGFVSRPSLSARCTHLKRSVRRRAGQAATSVVGCPINITKNADAGWGFTSSRRAHDTDDTEDDSVTSESAPINWTRWNEIEIGELSPEIEIAAVSRVSKSMEDFGELSWDEGSLKTSASSKLKVTLPESTSVAGSSTEIEHQCWENRYRVSNKSAQLLEPVRGKLTTLSSLLRTMSDRYYRRTGKRAPGNGQSSNNNNNNNNSNNNMPVLRQSQSAAPWSMQSQQLQGHRHKSNTTSRMVNGVPKKRYDNPFQDFLRQSFAEKHSRSVHESDRQR